MLKCKWYFIMNTRHVQNCKEINNQITNIARQWTMQKKGNTINNDNVCENKINVFWLILKP